MADLTQHSPSPGVEIDTTPATIGRGLVKHRTAMSTYSQMEMENHMAKGWVPLTKGVVVPTEQEVARNPRSRSAKLRAADRQWWLWSVGDETVELAHNQLNMLLTW